MKALVKRTRIRGPVDILIEAVDWAIVHGYRIGLTDYGVRCASSSMAAVWERDPMFEAVDPLGAAILMLQPDKAQIPDAAAAAIGESIPVVEGLAAGLGLRPKSSSWMHSRLRDLYQWGWQAGANLRIAITSRVCPEHGQYAMDERACPTCGARHRLLGDAPGRGDR